MHRTAFFLPHSLLFTFLWVGASLQGAEPGKILYQQEFTSAKSLEDFDLTDAKAWKWVEKDGEKFVEQFQASKYKPTHRSPFNLALLKTPTVGDFIVDYEVQSTCKEYGHRDMVFVFGYQNPDQFYYCHIASKADDHANNVFVVNKAPRIKNATTTNKGNTWGSNAWKKVRIVRTASTGDYEVFFEDFTKPIMVGNDKSFGKGRIGFGTFDDTCRIRKLTIYQPAGK
ncbi:MAG: hypothetical protein R3B84_10805 [Zavarzinella sp.]